MIRLLGVSFSLHQASESALPHPFQKATWSHHDILVGTNFLATLLHADLWLKSIVIPGEMSAKSPFHIRSFEEGASLPPNLFYRLFLEHGIEFDESLPSATRLWIESNSIKYHRAVNGENVTYILGPADMQMKYRNLMR